MPQVDRAVSIYARLIDRLPAWARLAFGAASTIVGALLVLNPMRSLGALLVLLSIGLVLNGFGELLRADRAPLASVALGVVLIGVGIAVLSAPGWSIAGLAVLLALTLIVSGGIGAVRAIGGRSDQRAADLMLALASIGVGILAFAWPDVTVIVMAALFGVRLVMFGVDTIVRALRSGEPDPDAAPPGRTGTVRRWARTVAAGAALIVAAGGFYVTEAMTGSPSIDDFYAHPHHVPAEPGRLVKSEKFTRAVPDGARAVRILYTTTTHDGTHALASAIVIEPDDDEQHPVIAWAHGTTGFARPCAPSLLDDPFEAGAMPDLQATLAQGWAIVATDYAGLGTEGTQPYLVGRGEAHSVLDSVRAVRELGSFNLGEQTVIWGHSQGGHAALWAGGLAPSYAPDIDLDGVAALAPAANLPALLAESADSPIGAVFTAFALAAYAEHYPSVRQQDYVRPGARIMVESMQQRCVSDPATIASVATVALSGQTPWSQPLNSGPLGKAVVENIPDLLVSAPLLIAQGGRDAIVTATSQDAYVKFRCDGGQVLDYRTFDGEDHLSIVADNSPLIAELLAWTAERFERMPGANSCWPANT